MPSSDVASELAASLGQTLPATYAAFLDGLPLRPTLGERYSPILDFVGRRWRPFDRKRLAESMPCRKREIPVPYAHQIAKVAADMRVEDTECDGAITAELSEKGFSIDRLARGFCVGDDGNGEPLFVDPETGAVYAFYHDGMDLERWATSLDELIAGSRDWTGDEEA